MRIVSWNCCWQKEGFTDEKRNEILKLNPDILIVQECKPDDWEKLNYSSEKGHWYGDGKESQGDPNKNLGIGIFCNEKYSIDCSLFKDQDLSKMRYVLPYIIKMKDVEILTIFSVWAKSGYKYYHVPILNSLEYFYEKNKSPIILAGDFNTGSQYGNEKESYYKFIKEELKTKYFLINCAFWQEWLPTYHEKENENYNFFLDDHCFSGLWDNVLSFSMGNWSHWSKYSDHVPIMIDFDDNLFEKIIEGQKSSRLTKQELKVMKQMRENYKGHYTPTTFKYGDYEKEI